MLFNPRTNSEAVAAIHAEASEGVQGEPGVGYYSVVRLERNSVEEVLEKAFEGSASARALFELFANLARTSKHNPPGCMVCEIPVPLRPPPNWPAMALVRPGFDGPIDKAFVMLLCADCDVRTGDLRPRMTQILARELNLECRSFEVSEGGHA